MRYGFLVETYETERLKVLGVWSMFRDEDLPVRPHATDRRGRSVHEQMVHQCVSEDLWFRTMLGIGVSVSALPEIEGRLDFIKRYATSSAVIGYRVWTLRCGALQVRCDGGGARSQQVGDHGVGVALALGGGADEGGEDLLCGGAPPGAIAAADCGPAWRPGRFGAALSGFANGAAWRQPARRGGVKLPLQPRILVFQPFVALVQPRILALEPVAFVLDALKVAAQSLGPFVPRGLGSLLPVSMSSHTVLMPYLRQEYPRKMDPRPQPGNQLQTLNAGVSHFLTFTAGDCYCAAALQVCALAINEARPSVPNS